MCFLNSPRPRGIQGSIPRNIHDFLKLLHSRSSTTIFLKPHSDEELLKRLDSKRLAEYAKEMEGYNAHRTSGSNEPFDLNGLDYPFNYHSYPTVKELRMDLREWTQDNKLIQQGTHFPLCIKLGKSCANSKAKQLERTPGTDRYKANQEAKNTQ